MLEKQIKTVVESNGYPIKGIKPLLGGQRNQIFLCDSDFESMVVKVHKPSKYFDFYQNEVFAYQLLGRQDISMPRLLFSNEELRLLGITKIDGELLQESKSLDYYLSSLELLKKTKEELDKIKMLGKSFFRREPSSLLEGIEILNKSLNIDVTIDGHYQDMVKLLTNSSKRYNLGSFIPNNIIVGPNGECSHIDFEMFSVGTETEDLAYFTLYSGLDPNLIFETYYEHSNSSGLYDEYIANITKLGFLTLGIYTRDLKKEMPESKRRILNDRISNFLNVMSFDSNTEQIRGVINGFNL